MNPALLTSRRSQPEVETLGPASAALAQVASGTPTVAEMARNTGIEEGLLRSALAHLVRTGRIEAHELPTGCPPQACGGCAVASSCGGSATASGRRLVTLTIAR